VRGGTLKKGGGGEGRYNVVLDYLGEGGERTQEIIVPPVSEKKGAGVGVPVAGGGCRSLFKATDRGQTGKRGAVMRGQVTPAWRTTFH